MVCVNPGAFATPVHNNGGSIRVTVDVSRGKPFTRVVIFAPTANGRSILASAMTSPGHSAGLVHTAHTSSALAEEWDDPPKGPFAAPISVIFSRLAPPLCRTDKPAQPQPVDEFRRTDNFGEVSVPPGIAN